MFFRLSRVKRISPGFAFPGLAGRLELAKGCDWGTVLEIWHLEFE